jgi:hypothetical protein
MPTLRDVVAKRTVFDAVIVGAGPSGSACAYWLAQAGLVGLSDREEALPAREDLRRRAHPAIGLPTARDGSRRRRGREWPSFQGITGLRLRRVARDELARAPRLPQLRLHDHPLQPRRTRRGAGRGVSVRCCSAAWRPWRCSSRSTRPTVACAARRGSS